MLLGIPSDVKRVFEPIIRDLSKPIAKSLAPMVLAFLLAPHFRRLKTIAGMVFGHRVHVGTISRRLINSALENSRLARIQRRACEALQKGQQEAKSVAWQSVGLH